MRTILLIAGIAFIVSFIACKSSSGPKTFCDTTCLKDTVKFSGDHELKPYVYISAKDCLPDSIIWSYAGMGVNRKAGFAYLLNATPHLNKEYVRCYIKDTAYAWIFFNDCTTGRGYQLKLPFNKSGNFGIKSSGINNLDPKFAVADNLVVNTDRGNIYVEDAVTGKKAMMTFGKATDIDYDAIHEVLDTVSVSNTRIWVKVKIDGAWKELEKNITLE
jgi:hypothetical protein